MKPATADLAKLSFPLNVYAALQLWAEGEVRYLHFGLFEQGDDLWQAQERSSHFIAQQLPPPPARILEVGIGLGSTTARLVAAGYEVVGVTPEAAQIALAAPLAPTAQLLCSRFEDLPDLGLFDVVLFQESAQYIDSLALLNGARRRLRPQGVLLVTDEFSVRRTSANDETLHHLTHFIAQAARCGFALRQRQDFGQQAVATLDYLLELQSRFQQRLIDELGVHPAQLDALSLANRTYRQRYDEGRYGYAFLALSPDNELRWRVDTLASDHPQVLDLFVRSFGATMSADLWRWKYADGRGHAIGVWQGERLVCHYGGMTRRIHCLGQPAHAVQIGDVMVDPAERGVLTRRGPFALAAATFLEQEIGYATRHLLGYGFPTRRAMKVASSLGLYAQVDHMVRLQWAPLPIRRTYRIKVRQLQAADADFDRVTNSLWQAMADDFRGSILAVRDADYLRYRYTTHPHNAYQLWVVRMRLSNAPLGLIAVRAHDQELELLDIVAPTTHFDLCITQARRIAAAQGLARVHCMVTASGMERLRNGAEVVGLDTVVPCNVWSEGPPPEALQNHWWLMGGDSDFR